MTNLNQTRAQRENAASTALTRSWSHRMNTYVTVSVTKTDILRGKREDYDSCPVAIATRRAFRNIGLPYYFQAFEDRVELIQTFGLWKTETGWGCELPKRAQSLIARFDAGVSRARIRPITFRLPVPEPASLGILEQGATEHAFSAHTEV